MRRIGNLYNKIISLENLQEADKKARKGKKRSYGVRWHDRNRNANIEALHEMLRSKTYKTSKYDVFKIYEPKERDIYRLPYYPDRIVHHAIMNILEPIWVSIFTADTYSCIKGKGIHDAVKSLQRALRKNEEATRYCLKIDIKKYYPSINHDILKEIIRRKIKDSDLLWLLDEIIDSVPDAQGVPIGNYLSQYLANLYLAYFDHWIKEDKNVKYYWRYADDIVVLSDNKAHLKMLLFDIGCYLEKNLKLEIKDNWQIFPVSSRGIDFLGYVFYHTHTKLRKSIKQRLARKVAKSKKNIECEKHHRSIASYWGWMKHCNSVNLEYKLFNNTRYENKFKR